MGLLSDQLAAILCNWILSSKRQKMKGHFAKVGNVFQLTDAMCLVKLNTIFYWV